MRKTADDTNGEKNKMVADGMEPQKSRQARARAPRRRDLLFRVAIFIIGIPACGDREALRIYGRS